MQGLADVHTNSPLFERVTPPRFERSTLPLLERGLTPLVEGAGANLEAVGRVGTASLGDAAPLKAGVETLDHAKRRLDGFGGLGWSVVGFLVGAVFWHFVGFWEFMSDVVLADRAAQVGQPLGGSSTYPDARELWLRTAEGLRTAEAAVPQVSGGACISLHLDRATGLTTSRACDANAPSLPMDRHEGREDREIASVSAGGAIETSGTTGR